MKRFKAGMSHIARSENGSATIEVAIWLPLIAFLLVFTVDLSLMFHNMSQISKMVHDTNRGFAVGLLETEDDAENFLKSKMSKFTDTALVDVALSGTEVTSRVDVAMSDISIVTGASPLKNKTVTIAYSHLMQD